MENQQLTPYSVIIINSESLWDEKSQLEAAPSASRRKCADLKDFVARNKARVATRNMAMSRQAR